MLAKAQIAYNACSPKNVSAVYKKYAFYGFLGGEHPSAGEILSRVNGESTLGEIIAALEAQFPEAEGLADDVLAFMREAEAKNWLKI